MTGRLAVGEATQIVDNPRHEKHHGEHRQGGSQEPQGRLRGRRVRRDHHRADRHSGRRVREPQRRLRGRQVRGDRRRANRRP
jgi:hypothetical protein